MSNRAAGKRFENRIADYLKSLGFAVEKARAVVKFVGPGKAISGPQDILGVADIMAIHPQRSWTLFIQATLGSISPRLKKLESVDWSITGQRVQLWTRQVGMQGGIRVLTLNQDKGWVEEFFRLKNGKWPPDGIL
jgi:hypothetical protein